MNRNRLKSGVRLWTFQREAIVPQLQSRETHFASWDHVPENWRLAYEWMSNQMYSSTGAQGDSPPIWCWHSCNGKAGASPTVGTARLLLGDYDFEQGMITLELSVPTEALLLSSYGEWNEFLDHVIEHQRVPGGPKRHSWLFQQPLIKDAHDDIQAVIPYIKQEWIKGISKLTIADRDWDETI